MVSVEKSVSVKIGQSIKSGSGSESFRRKNRHWYVIKSSESLSVRLKVSESVSVRIGSVWIGLTLVYTVLIYLQRGRVPDMMGWLCVMGGVGHGWGKFIFASKHATVNEVRLGFWQQYNSYNINTSWNNYFVASLWLLAYFVCNNSARSHNLLTPWHFTHLFQIFCPDKKILNLRQAEAELSQAQTS